MADDDIVSQFLRDFHVLPDPQENTANDEGLLDDFTNSNALNSPFQTFMAPPPASASSAQSRSLLSLPQPSFNQLSFPITAPTNDQQLFNHNNFFTTTPTPAQAQNTWTLNEHNVPNDFRALIQPQAQAFAAESRAENTPECSTTLPNHFHNPGFSGALMGQGQPGQSGRVAFMSSLPATQPEGGGLSLTEHQDKHTHTQNIAGVVPETTSGNAPTSSNVLSPATSSALPSIPPASNRPDLPYVLCCLPGCYKIYQGMDAFITHLRAGPTAPDPGHNLKTSSTPSRTARPVKCAWHGCGYHELVPASLPKHLEQHALIDWMCAVPGCGSSAVPTKVRALKHFMDEHDELRGRYVMEGDRVYQIPSKHRRGV